MSSSRSSPKPKIICTTNFSPTLKTRVKTVMKKNRPRNLMDSMHRRKTRKKTRGSGRQVQAKIAIQKKSEWPQQVKVIWMILSSSTNGRYQRTTNRVHFCTSQLMICSHSIAASIVMTSTCYEEAHAIASLNISNRVKQKFQALLTVREISDARVICKYLNTK